MPVFSSSLTQPLSVRERLRMVLAILRPALQKVQKARVLHAQELVTTWTSRRRLYTGVFLATIKRPLLAEGKQETKSHSSPELLLPLKHFSVPTTPPPTPTHTLV